MRGWTLGRVAFSAVALAVTVCALAGTLGPDGAVAAGVLGGTLLICWAVYRALRGSPRR